MSVYMGIDWSVKKHDFAILNEAGKVIAQAVISHQKSGFKQLDETRAALGVTADACPVGMEDAQRINPPSCPKFQPVCLGDRLSFTGY